MGTQQFKAMQPLTGYVTGFALGVLLLLSLAQYHLRAITVIWHIAIGGWLCNVRGAPSNGRAENDPW
jgi:hypothetical protein